MKQINQYILNLYHFVLNVRDTMEYTIQREHTVAKFQNRKKVIEDSLLEGSAFGNFLLNNGETGEKLREQVKTFLDELYGPEQNIIVVAGDKLRIDNTQNIKIFETVYNMVEPLRDILNQFVTMTKQQRDNEVVITNLITLDERMFRVVFDMLVMRQFENSFAEFNKMMAESKGQQTPQSNFIVQNELVKLASVLRASRRKVFITDNETLDLLDDVLKVVEMTEGRRDRPGQKSFKDIFEDINRRLAEYVNKIEPEWKGAYDLAVNELVADQKKAAEEKAAQEKAAEDKETAVA